MPRNIEMNVLNNGEYEILYPQTLSECVIGLLSDETKVLMGLTSENTPDDAFRELYLSIVLDGRALINFTVMGNDGTPCKGVQLASSNFCDGNGNKLPTVTTDDNGKISVFVDAISVNVSVSQYANFENWSHTYSVTFGEQYDENVTLNRRNFLKMTSSGSCKFSPEIVRVDVTCVGGGGRCGNSESSSVQGLAGAGGGGGYCTVQENVNFSVESMYNYVIGAGSNDQSENYAGEWEGVEYSYGGTTSFLNVSATGGQSAKDGQYNNFTGGAGNGKGGDSHESRDDDNGFNGEQGEAGIVLGYSSFTESIYYGGGGGGGGAANASDGRGAVGGMSNGYGGKGGDGWTNQGGENGQNGFGGGGGGAGATANVYDNATGGRGGSGCVAIRMYTAETLPA